MGTTEGVEPTIRVRLTGDVLNVTFNCPRTKNSVTRAAAEFARDAMEAGPRQGARVIVISGEGSTFCSGADIGEMKSGSETTPEGDPISGMLDAIMRSPVPVVAKVRGYALGLGMAAAAACTIVVCADDAVFGLPEAKLGLFPRAMVPFLSHRLRPSDIVFLGLTTRRLSGMEALDRGLADLVVADDELDAVVGEMAIHLAALGHVASDGLDVRRQLIDQG